VGKLAGRNELDPTGLASLLLDRSCPRPASLAAAGDWWENVLDRLLDGDILHEAVWNSEDDLLTRLAEDEGREIFTRALKQLPPGGPTAGEAREHFVMGHVMRDLRGRVPGRRVRAWVQEATG
jgi:hypothetical protein